MTLFERHVSRSVQFVALLCCLSASMLASQMSRGASSPLRVTFLGTGSPAVSVERFSPCILVEAGPQKFIFDAGRGWVLRLQQARIAVPTLTGVFVTHLHSDHVLSIPDLFLTRWTQRNESPFRVWGPSGTQAMMSHVVAAYEFDINARVKNGRRRPELAVQDVSAGIVFNQDGIVVRAFEVDHGDIEPALGYRIDVAGRSLVLSGDTRPSETLIRVAEGVDVLVHEVAHGAAKPTAQQQYVLDNHTTPARAAEVLRRVKPRLAVYSHIILQAGATEAQVMAITRENYAGRVELATDLSVVDIGSEITFERGR